MSIAPHPVRPHPVQPFSGGVVCRWTLDRLLHDHTSRPQPISVSAFREMSPTERLMPDESY